MQIKTNIKVIFFLFTILFGCQNTKKKHITKTTFGKQKGSDSPGAELVYDKYYNWGDIIKETERMVCNDSIPKITLKFNHEIKTIYFHNPCWEDFGCILIKAKNTIEIHNDTIIKNHQNFYPLDSLKAVLKRDLENNGKIPNLSDSPKKFLIYISYDKNKFENFPKTLDKLTQAYQHVTNKTDINIWLNKRLNIPPPPPIN